MNAEYDFDKAKEILDSDEYTVYSSFKECIDIFLSYACTDIPEWLVVDYKTMYIRDYEFDQTFIEIEPLDMDNLEFSLKNVPFIKLHI